MRGHAAVPVLGRLGVYAVDVPVVCVRMTDEALAALDDEAAKEGLGRSAWLRTMLMGLLELHPTSVEDVTPPPGAILDVRVPGDTLNYLDPPDPTLPPGAIRP